MEVGELDVEVGVKKEVIMPDIVVQKCKILRK